MLVEKETVIARAGMTAQAVDHKLVERPETRKIDELVEIDVAGVSRPIHRTSPVAEPDQRNRMSTVRSRRLDDAQKPEQDHNHHDGDYETKDTAHISFLS
jgi:hypothetical protein